MLWGYPNIPRWRDALGLPPVKAGRLYGMTGPLGTTEALTGNMSYFGVCHLFMRKSGVYVAAIMRDGRTGGGLGPDIGQPEGQGGQLVRFKTEPDGKPRTFVIAGGQDARVTEVLGLETIESLPGGKYVHTRDDVHAVQVAQKKYRQQLASQEQLTISRGRKALKVAEPVSKTVDTDRNFSVRAAYDAENLYVRYRVTSPTPLANGISDPRLTFKGGNCLDIQMGTNPDADPDRTKPAPGDIRILVTRRKGEPRAVLYRPKIKGFDGEPTVLRSPTGQESFDRIEVVDEIELSYREHHDNTFTATATIPHEVTGWNPRPGTIIKMDVGYLFANTGGTKMGTRAYWQNNSFSANVVNDIPHESRLEPHEWGDAVVE
jgi:hypothetical protein